jgi:hypothetical protein
MNRPLVARLTVRPPTADLCPRETDSRREREGVGGVEVVQGPTTLTKARGSTDASLDISTRRLHCCWNAESLGEIARYGSCPGRISC